MNLTPPQGAVMAAVAASATIVSHNEVLVRVQMPDRDRFVLLVVLKSACILIQIRLKQLLAIDIYMAFVNGHRFSGQTNDTFDRVAAAVVGDDHHVSTSLHIRNPGLDDVTGVKGGAHAFAVHKAERSQGRPSKFDDRGRENQSKNRAPDTGFVDQLHLIGTRECQLTRYKQLEGHPANNR